MPNTTVKWDGDAFVRRAKAAAERALAIACEEVRGQMKVNLSGPSPSKPDGFPGADTGRLSRELYNRSVSPHVRHIGTALAYGKYMEHGAKVRPKRVKYLPVPLNRAAKFLQRRLGGASLRTKNLTLIHRGGKMFLVTKTAGGKISKAKTSPAFVLKTLVIIKKRPWCYRTAMQTRARFQARYAAECQKGFASAAGGVT